VLLDRCSQALSRSAIRLFELAALQHSTRSG
jgi:hypothetical protein